MKVQTLFKVLRKHKHQVSKLLGVSMVEALTFVSLADALKLVGSLTTQLPRDVDMVIGVPRSGLLFANIIAQKMGLPLATTDTIGTPWQSKHISSVKKFNKVLLFDDSYRSGAALHEELDRLISLGFDRDSIVTASLIVSEKGRSVVDYYATLIDGPRLFEWNMLHKNMKLATDLDGVLCENPPSRVRHDEFAYERWLEQARPYLIPTFEIDTIITARLEKYRHVTETWLRMNGVAYKHLVMSNALSRQEQRERGPVHKVAELQRNTPAIYWESSFKEAVIISSQVSIPVLCTDEMKLV